MQTAETVGKSLAEDLHELNHHAGRASGLNPAIYDSLEELEIYLLDVRSRREQRRQARQERQRLTVAVGRVQAELGAARQEEDEEIVAELQMVLQGFEQRLFIASAGMPALAVVRSRGSAEEAVPEALIRIDAFVKPEELKPEKIVEEKISEEKVSEERVQEPIAPFQPLSTTIEHLLQGTTGETIVEINEIIAQVEKPEGDETSQDNQAIPFEEMPPVPVVLLTEEERRERIETLNGRFETLLPRWREIDEAGLLLNSRELNRPLCFQARALACEIASLFAAARRQDVLAEMRRPLLDARDKIDLARSYARDNAISLPFEDAFWADADKPLLEEEWEELARYYEATAVAQTAWEWHVAHKELGEPSSRLPLLNAAAAAQQMLFRALEDFGGSDRMQGDLYVFLRAAATEIGYLTAMNCDMKWAELETLARQLPDMLAKTQRAFTLNGERRQKEERKAAAIQAVVSWAESRKSQALSKYTVSNQRAELLVLLDECFACGVPPTNVPVRSALLDVGPVLLEGQTKWSKILDAILTERRRKGMDAAPVEETPELEEEDDVTDSQNETHRQYAALLAENQKVLILGGTPRQRVCEDLKQMLHCGEVRWPENRKSDRASKFQSDIKRADILIMAKNFASHEMTEKGREWMRSSGGHYILLPSGYGVKQIIQQLYNYAVAREGS